jgi:hypothetical protein
MLRQPPRRPARRRTRLAMFRSAGRSRLSAAVLIACLVATLVPGAPGICRAASDDDMVTITKNTLYGGILGLILGGTLTLVVDSDSRDDVVRWGVVGGVFAGFGYGLYEVTATDDLLARGREWPAGEETPLVVGAARPLAYRLDPALGRLSPAPS